MHQVKRALRPLTGTTTWSRGRRRRPGDRRSPNTANPLHLCRASVSRNQSSIQLPLFKRTAFRQGKLMFPDQRFN